MKSDKTYNKTPLSFNRRAVIASASVTSEKNTIHSFTEVDISKPRLYMKEYHRLKGEKLSLTSYIVKCLAQTITEYPQFNSFISGRNIIQLENVTISVLVERELKGENVPEPLGIEKAEEKSYGEIQKEIQSAKNQNNDKLGSLSGIWWLNLIPTFLLKSFIRLADKNIKMGIKYGKIALTAVGMFSKEPLWIIPHGSPTVLASLGSIVKRVVETENGFSTREHLCLTVSFDHNLVDGAPAARFMNDFTSMIKEGEIIRALLEDSRE